MKKNLVLIFATGVSLVAMSFRPSNKNEKKLVTKIETANLASSTKLTDANGKKLTILVPVVVALAETSAAAVVVTAAAAYHWLFGGTQAQVVPENYKIIMHDMDMHNLDNIQK